MTVLSQDEQKTLKKNCKKDLKVLFYIFQVVDSTIFENVATSKMGKKACAILVKSYKGMEKV